MGGSDEAVLIERVERRLAGRYDHVSAERISVAVANAWKAFEQSSIRDFVPLLVERRAGAELSNA